MKIIATMILAAATGTAAPPQGEQPARTLVPHGSAFRCLSLGGCYVANEAGMQEMVDEVYEHGKAEGLASCSKDKGV